MQRDSGLRWQVNPLCQWYWRKNSEDSYILFDRASSKTHFLNAFGAGLLQLIEQASAQRCLSVAEITQQFVTEYEVEISSDELSHHIRDTLSVMDQLGLIEPCPQ